MIVIFVGVGGKDYKTLDLVKTRHGLTFDSNDGAAVGV